MGQRVRRHRVVAGALGGGIMPAVLMYHSISPYAEDPYLVTVSPSRFEQQMRWLHNRGQRGVSVAELLAARRQGRGGDLIGLTFDDGYADFAEYALPVLQRYEFTATVFVLAGRLGGENSWDPDGPSKPLLTADAVRRIADGGFEVGSHGLNHTSLTQAVGATVTAETENSRAVLQSVSGQPVHGFCYPYGHVGSRAVAGVRAAGYAYGCAIWPSERSGPYALPRIYVGDADTPPRLTAKAVRHWLTWEYSGPGASRVAGKFHHFA